MGIRDISKSTVRVTLAPLGGDIYLRVGQGQTSRGNHRRIWSVCFHGHFQFMREVYALAPEAVIRSGLRLMGENEIVYRSLADLERIAPAVGETNIGSGRYPLALEDACVCMDYNVGGVLPDWAEIARTAPDEYETALHYGARQRPLMAA